MIEIRFLVKEDPDGGFNARAVGESIVTQGADLEEFRTNIRDAVDRHFGDSDICN